MSNHRARTSRLTQRLFIRESGTEDKEMRRLLSIPRPASKAVLKAILKTVRVQAVAEAAVVAAEAAVRVEMKTGMIRVQVATMA